MRHLDPSRRVGRLCSSEEATVERWAMWGERNELGMLTPAVGGWQGWLWGGCMAAVLACSGAGVGDLENNGSTGGSSAAAGRAGAGGSTQGVAGAESGGREGVGIGAGGGDPRCVPQDIRPCEGSVWFQGRTCTTTHAMEMPTEECSGVGFDSHAECLQACDPDSPCLISPPLSLFGDPCIPEIHTSGCWYGNCGCSCQEAGTSYSWICAC